MKIDQYLATKARLEKEGESFRRAAQLQQNIEHARNFIAMMKNGKFHSVQLEIQGENGGRYILHEHTHEYPGNPTTKFSPHLVNVLAEYLFDLAKEFDAL